MDMAKIVPSWQSPAEYLTGHPVPFSLAIMPVGGPNQHLSLISGLWLAARTVPRQWHTDLLVVVDRWRRKIFAIIIV
jgi:hypothetical protein